MLTRRIFTVVILLAFPLLNGITGNEKPLLKESSVIGSLVTRVNKASGNSSSLDSLSFFIRNSSKGTNNFSALSELKEGYEKSYLLSLLQKKKEEYDEM
ncbi:hypothetical protein EHM76_05945, partial [bacterium]